MGPTHVPRGGGSRGGQEPKGIGRAEHAGAHGGGTVPGTHTRTVAEDCQDESPQPLPALISSFAPPARPRRRNSSSAFFFSPPTLPLKQTSDETKRRGPLPQSQHGRRGRRHHSFIHSHQSQQSPRERRHHTYSSKSSQPARPARIHDIRVNQEQHQTRRRSDHAVI